MTTTLDKPVQFKNPLKARAARTRAHEDYLAQQQQQQADEAAAAEQAQQQQQADEAAAAAEQAEQQRKEALRLKHLTRQVRTFAEGLFAALDKAAVQNRWTADEMEAASTHAEQMLRPEHVEIEIEGITPEIIEIVRNRFLFGLAYNKEELPNIFEVRYFPVMREKGFTDEFLPVLKTARKVRKNNEAKAAAKAADAAAEAAKRSKVVYTTTSTLPSES